MAHTVLDQKTRDQYTASIGETNFSYTFKIFEDDNLDVYQTPNGQVPDPDFDILILNVDYTVTGAGDTGGGDIILVVPATAGDIITIELNIPPDRLFDYTTGGEFTGESINAQLDKLTKLVQQNKGINDNRQLTYKVTDTLTTGDVTLPYLEINQFWMKNASGGLVNVTLEQNPDWSTLRTELLNDQSGTAGSTIVGHYSTVNSSTTVSVELESIQTHVKQGSTYYGVTAGTPNAYTATIADFPSSYQTGVTLELRIHQVNTGSSGINVNGLGGKDIVNAGLHNFEAGTLEAGGTYIFIYNGTEFVLNRIMRATNLDKGAVKLNQTVRAWAHFYWTGAAVVINDSYNISSITRIAAGRYTVNFPFTWGNAYYCLGGVGESGATSLLTVADVPYVISTTSINIALITAPGGVLTDPTVYGTVYFVGY